MSPDSTFRGKRYNWGPHLPEARYSTYSRQGVLSHRRGSSPRRCPSGDGAPDKYQSRATLLVPAVIRMITDISPALLALPTV